MLLGLGKTITFGQKKIYPYATGGDYVYLYEEDGKTYRVHEFLTTGTSTLEVEVGGKMECLVVGGGGGGAYGRGAGGGGAGGVLVLDDASSLSLAKGSYTITVGNGGAATTTIASVGGDGQDSSITGNGISKTAIGGGGGGAGSSNNGRTGGSGGGGHGADNTLTPGNRTLGGAGESGPPVQGNAGGDGSQGTGTSNSAGGGGGGAGASGQDGESSGQYRGGNGGDGIEWPLGSGTYYGGGGGGGTDYNVTSFPGGIGGLGGGGNGANRNNTNTTYPLSAGVANTGGGGGGATRSGSSAAGGSGIVIVRYVIAEKKLWTPSELGSSVAAWYDADDSSTITLNGSNVSQWSDKSGNGKHAIQNNSSLQPAYTTAGLNNRNVVTLTQDELAVTNLVLTGQGHEVYTIATLESSSNSNGRLFSLKNTNQNNDYNNTTSWIPVFRYGGNEQIAAYQQGSSTIYAATYGAPVLISSTISSGLTVRVNGAVEGTKATSTDLNTTAGLLIGQSLQTADENWDGIVGEIVFTDELSTADRQKLEGYLAHKWGLTDNLPSGHPYKYEPPYKEEPEEIVTDSLVLNLDAGDYASYPRSGTTWYDISGNGNDGTLTNGPTYDSANKGSIVFDGSNDYVEISGSSTTNIQSSMTVSAWIKSASSDSWNAYWSVVSKYNQFILGPNNIGTNADMAFLVYTNTWYPFSYNTAIWGQSGLDYSKWHQFTGVYDSSTNKIALYVDGQVEVENLSVSGSVASDTGRIHLMHRDYSSIGTHHLGGTLGNVQIYNRALSSTEIQQNYNALKGRYGL